MTPDFRGDMGATKRLCDGAGSDDNPELQRLCCWLSLFSGDGGKGAVLWSRLQCEM